MITFEIDGKRVQAPKGSVLVDAAKRVGIEIPIFCYEPRLGAPIGACRMCLVEVEGARGLQTGCSTVVTPDMVVRTTTPAVKEAQDGVLELLLANHPLDCPVCDKGGECPLQDRTFAFGPGKTRFVEPKRHFPKPLDLSPVVAIDRERCIACYRCVRFSQDVAEDGQLTFQERGDQTEVATFSGDPYVGRFTGNIIDLCPVGALTSVPYRFVSRPWDVANTPSVCGHCAVGCNTELTVREGEIKRVTGRPEPNMAVEEGWLCDKGRWAYDTARSADRIANPLIIDGAGRRQVPIERAVSAAAAILLDPKSRVGLLVGPDATVEEGFLAQGVAAALGNAPISRLGIPGHGLSGLRSVPGAQLGDLDRADVIVVVGGDLANQQPVVELRLRKARRIGARIITVNHHATAVQAIAAAHIACDPGAIGAALDELRQYVAAAARPVVVWDERELAAEPAAARALAGLLADKPDGRQLELGAATNGAGLRAIGLSIDGVLEALEAGQINVLFTIHADPVGGPGGSRWAAALKNVKVIEIATHATALTPTAAVVMAGLTTDEREGTLVSMAGRVQRLRAGANGPAGAAPAWEILIAIAHRFPNVPAERTPAQVFERLAKTNVAFAGMTYGTLGIEGTPLSAVAAPASGTARSVAPTGEGLVLVATTPIYGGSARPSTALAPLRARASVTLHPTTAATLGLTEGAVATITSAVGQTSVPTQISDEVSPLGAYVWLGLDGGAEALMGVDQGTTRVTIRPGASA